MFDRRRYYSADELGAILGISRVTLWRWAANGKIPKSVQLGPNRIAWRGSELADWDAKRERVTYKAGA